MKFDIYPTCVAKYEFITNEQTKYYVMFKPRTRGVRVPGLIYEWFRIKHVSS